MNRKYIGAAILAAAVALSGCAKTDVGHQTQPSQSTSVPTSSENSSEVSASSSSDHQSTRSVSIPESSPLEIPAETSSAEERDEASAPAVTLPPSMEDPQPLERETVGADDTRTVSSGETLYIESGRLMEIEGTLTVESGAFLNVAEGGELLVNGAVRLDGELVLSEGGKLTMGSDNAEIDGSGSVVVKKDFEQIDCERGTIKTHITPPERVVTDGVTTVGGVVIANKAIKLPPEFGSHLSLDEVEPEVYAALQEMSDAAGHWYVNRSGYRSYWYQQSTFQNNVDLFGFERADMLSSRAGHSEHQTGLTMDLDSFDQNYGTTPDGKWLADNCWRFGFIIRYPKGKEHITGYEYEPWHVRYLGKSTANLVYHSGLTLEEFLNVEGGMVVVD